MAIIIPFAAFRPLKDKVAQIASRPYDVLSSEEARKEAEDNDYSFLHVIKPEIDLPPDISPYDQAVYEQGRKYFMEMLDEGTFFQDSSPCFYLYQLEMNGRIQNGIVGLAAVRDYEQGIIRKHELTRPDKEEDRRTHIRVLGMNPEPVFFAYKAQNEIDEIVNLVLQGTPEYDFVAEDGIVHRLWIINQQELINQLITLFGEKVPYTYVADGHHRTAAAAGVGLEMRESNPHHTGKEPYNYFMAVHFPDTELEIIDYNRLVSDLNGHNLDSFLEAISHAFEIEKLSSKPYKPQKLHEISLYAEHNWYKLTALPHTFDEVDPIKGLDVTVLSKQILEPVLGIKDLRRDKRIDFVGGIRGLEELQERVDSGEMKMAFALYPVSMDQLIAIADNGSIMPPKTTWFEPKLRSGMFIHKFL